MAHLNLAVETMEASSEAQRLFVKAIELDPEFAAAYGWAAYCYVWRQRNGWMVDRAREVAEAKRLARQATEFGKDDAVALTAAGLTVAYVVGDVEGGAALLDRARSLNPNSARAWEHSAWVQVFLGKGEAAIEHAFQSMRLNPLDPIRHSPVTATAFGYLSAGRYDEASAWGERALLLLPDYRPALRVTAASHALAGAEDNGPLAPA
jgi:tetratricopeptide (TPR) repeat protein